MAADVISSLHFESAFLSGKTFCHATVEEGRGQDHHRSSCSSDDSILSVWSQRPDSLSSLSSTAYSDTGYSNKDDMALVDPVSTTIEGDIANQLQSIQRPDAWHTEKSYREQYHYNTRTSISRATIAALTSQRRSISSSPWTCLEESHHPLCPGDCDIGIAESETSNTRTQPLSAASSRSSISSLSSFVKTAGLNDSPGHDQNYSWLKSPPVLVRQVVGGVSMTYSAAGEQLTSRLSTHRRNKTVLCAPSFHAIKTVIHMPRIGQCNADCPSYSSPTAQPTRGHGRNGSNTSTRLSKLLDRHPRASTSYSSLRFKSAEDFAIYLRLHQP